MDGARSSFAWLKKLQEEKLGGMALWTWILLKDEEMIERMLVELMGTDLLESFEEFEQSTEVISAVNLLKENKCGCCPFLSDSLSSQSCH